MDDPAEQNEGNGNPSALLLDSFKFDDGLSDTVVFLEDAEPIIGTCSATLLSTSPGQKECNYSNVASGTSLDDLPFSGLAKSRRSLDESHKTVTFSDDMELSLTSAQGTTIQHLRNRQPNNPGEPSEERMRKRKFSPPPPPPPQRYFERYFHDHTQQQQPARQKQYCHTNQLKSPGIFPEGAVVVDSSHFSAPQNATARSSLTWNDMNTRNKLNSRLCDSGLETQRRPSASSLVPNPFDFEYTPPKSYGEALSCSRRTRAKTSIMQQDAEVGRNRSDAHVSQVPLASVHPNEEARSFEGEIQMRLGRFQSLAKRLVSIMDFEAADCWLSEAVAKSRNNLFYERNGVQFLFSVVKRLSTNEHNPPNSFSPVEMRREQSLEGAKLAERAIKTQKAIWEGAVKRIGSLPDNLCEIERDRNDTQVMIERLTRGETEALPLMSTSDLPVNTMGMKVCIAVPIIALPSSYSDTDKPKERELKKYGCVHTSVRFCGALCLYSKHSEEPSQKLLSFIMAIARVVSTRNFSEPREVWAISPQADVKRLRGGFKMSPGGDSYDIAALSKKETMLTSGQQLDFSNSLSCDDDASNLPRSVQLYYYARGFQPSDRTRELSPKERPGVQFSSFKLNQSRTLPVLEENTQTRTPFRHLFNQQYIKGMSSFEGHIGIGRNRIYSHEHNMVHGKCTNTNAALAAHQYYLISGKTDEDSNHCDTSYAWQLSKQDHSDKSSPQQLINSPLFPYHEVTERGFPIVAHSRLGETKSEKMPFQYYQSTPMPPLRELEQQAPFVLSGSPFTFSSMGSCAEKRSCVKKDHSTTHLQPSSDKEEREGSMRFDGFTSAAISLARPKLFAAKVVHPGRAKRCQKEGCAKGAQGTTLFCIAHGGGRRCKYSGEM